MAKQSETGKDMAVSRPDHLAASTSEDAGDLQQKISEMQRIVGAVHQLAEDLKQIDCGLEISIGDSQAATVFAAMMGLSGQQTKTGGETAVQTTSPAEVTPQPEEEADPLPFHLDRCTLPRIAMTALRETQKVVYLDEIDREAFIQKYSEYGRLKANVITEVLIRLFLGNPGELLEVHDLMLILNDLGIEPADGRESSFRTDIVRRLRKLMAAGFIKRVVGSHGIYGALYRLNPEYDPFEPFVKRYFFGKVHPYLHRKKGETLPKKHRPTRYRF